MLSHAAIRARSQDVLFATCFESSETDALKSLDGQYVAVSVDPSGGVTAQAASADEVSLLCHLSPVSSNNFANINLSSRQTRSSLKLNVNDCKSPLLKLQVYFHDSRPLRRHLKSFVIKSIVRALDRRGGA